jgi:hypothetical protein
MTRRPWVARLSPCALDYVSRGEIDGVLSFVDRHQVNTVTSGLRHKSGAGSHAAGAQPLLKS